MILWGSQVTCPAKSVCLALPAIHQLARSLSLPPFLSPFWHLKELIPNPTLYWCSKRPICCHQLYENKINTFILTKWTKKPTNTCSHLPFYCVFNLGRKNKQFHHWMYYIMNKKIVLAATWRLLIFLIQDTRLKQIILIGSRGRTEKEPRSSLWGKEFN